MSARSLSFAVTGHRAELRRKLACRPLTNRQHQVLEFMREFFRENDQLRAIACRAVGAPASPGGNAVGKLRFVREP